MNLDEELTEKLNPKKTYLVPSSLGSCKDDSSTLLNSLKKNNSKVNLIDSNSDSFEYELDNKKINRIIMKPSQPEKAYVVLSHSIISCSVITTVSISNMKFSFITKPKNDNKNFFLRRNDEEEKLDIISDLISLQNSPSNIKFEMNHWSASKTNNKISEDIMTNFLCELNLLVEPINTKIENMKKDFRDRKNVFAKIALFSLIIFIISLFSLYVDIYIEPYFSFPFFLVFLLFAIVSGVSLILGLNFGIFRRRDEELEYSILLTILQKNKSIEDLLHKWNQETFLSLGVIVNIPHTLNYIHFCLDPYSEIILENHNLQIENQIN